MKKRPASQSNFFYPRVSIRFVLFLVAVFLALLGLGAYPPVSAQAQPQEESYDRVPSIISPVSPSNEPESNLRVPSARYRLLLDTRGITYILPALDLKSTETRAPDQTGVNRPVELSSRSFGKRFTTSDGTSLLVLAIKSPGAKRLRAHFDNFDLPAEDEVYLHAPADNSAVAGPYRDKGPWGDKDFWSRSIEGDTVIIEYHIHSKQGSFRIPEISHIYSDSQRRQSDPIPDVLECEVDASCYTDIRKNSVARIEFIRDGVSRVCTGTLLNDRAGDFTPYFLTANHCVSTQTIAQTVETYWFYQTTACNSSVLRSDIRHQTQGANLLVTASSKDFALLRLLDAPPGGVTFAGWSPSIIPVNSAVYGLHHPGNDVPPGLESYLRRAEGTISSTGRSCGITGLVSGYEVPWTSGLVEPGSSGSGLWYTGGVIGVLSCGPLDLSCTNRSGIYSKFSDFYPLIQPFIYPPKPDFDGDGHADIVWQNNTTGERRIWRMNGTLPIESVFLAWVGTEWQIAGTGDFDGNGQVDILWQNTATGERRIWRMNGTLPIESVFLAWVGTEWQIAGTGDFDGNGKVDILWQNTATGERRIWRMNGTQPLESVYVRTVGTEWQMAGAGDFDEGGQVDILWQNTTTGERRIWRMNGTQPLESVYVRTVGTEWDIRNH